MSDNSAIEWCDTTWNPTTGCDRVSEGCDNCLAPETRVLKADMTWVPIKSLNIGDRLVSFTETPAPGANRVWEEAVVEAVWETEQPTVEIELANGTRITASEDHRWLLAQRGASNWWRSTIKLNFTTQLRTVPCDPVSTSSEDYQAGYIAGVTAGDGTFRWHPEWRSSSVGYPQTYWRVAKLADDRIVLDRLVDYLAHVGVEVTVRPYDSGESSFTDNPRELAKVETRRLGNMPIIASLCEERESQDWMRGYLAGMFDTDASYSGGSLRYCQSKPNDVLDRIIRYGKELGFDLQREDYEGNCPTARLMGGISENIGFLSAISPALERRCRDFYGKRVATADVPVTGMRRGPVKRLIDITTSTGTFIAEGALTHNCYALTLAKRLKAMGSAKYQTDGNPRTSGPGFGLATHPDSLDAPLHWRAPRKVFVNSMSDLFHKDVPDGFIGSVWNTMALTPQHTYQILTKRPGRMRSLLKRWAADGWHWRDHEMRWCGPIPGPLPNVWMGVSVENQKWANVRIPLLIDTPAAVRFLSCEPLVGPVKLFGSGDGDCDELGPAIGHYPGSYPVDYGTGIEYDCTHAVDIDWVIAGGESGPHARAVDPDWIRSLRNECQWANVPFLFKQWGGRTAKANGRLLDGRTWDEYPTEVPA